MGLLGVREEKGFEGRRWEVAGRGEMGGLGKRGRKKLRGRKWGLGVLERREEEVGLRVGRGMEEEESEERVFMVLERGGMERWDIYIIWGWKIRRGRRDSKLKRWHFDLILVGNI